MTVIDLRSDTVTVPSPQMREAMAAAEVGDDVFGEDPTVNRFQEFIADLLGKEAALFVPSGTMGNEICINVLTRPGDEIICEQGCHIYNYESGALPFLSRVQARPLVGTRGVITAEQVAAAIRPPFEHLPRTRVVAIENTHNSAGGTIFPLEEMQQLYALTRSKNLSLHLDGARIWNAAAATGIAVAEYAGNCDTISVCFSKGLGAPVGSAVAGNKAFVQEAHRVRKIFGGGMRQVGLLAAAAEFAVKNNFDRLAEDHEHASALARGLAQLPGVRVDLQSVQTNIVIFDVAESGLTAVEAVEKLKQAGVLVVPFGETAVRAVTHLNVRFADIEKAIEVFGCIFR